MTTIKKVAGVACSLLMALTCFTVPAKADGYWVDEPYTDDSGTWYAGYWVETGPSTEQTWQDNSWSGSGWTEYHNGGAITYDAWGNWTNTSVTNVPVYYQKDKRWSGVYIGDGGAFGHTGCVPSAASSLLAHFGYYVSPLDMGYMMNSWGNYNANYGHGTDSSVWYTVAGTYGLTCVAVSDLDLLYAQLRAGKLVAGAVYVSGGYTHCVIMYGLDSAGRCSVCDPISGTYTAYVSNLFNNQSYDWVDWTAGAPFLALGYEW